MSYIGKNRKIALTDSYNRNQLDAKLDEKVSFDALSESEVETSTGQQTVSEALDQRVIYVDTVADLQALDTSGLVEGQQVSVGSYLPNTSTGSALLRWRPDLPKSRHDGVLFFSLTVPMFEGTNTADYRAGVGEGDPSGNGVFELVRGEIVYDAEVRIPADYESWADAFYDLNSRLSLKNGAEVSLTMEDGAEVTKALYIKDSDARHYKLRSESSPVLLADNFAPSFDASGAPTSGEGELFVCDNSHFPLIDCLVDMEDRYGSGLWVRSGVANVSTNCGVKNAGGFGFWVGMNGTLTAHNSDFSGSGAGNRVTTRGNLSVHFANLSGAKNENAWHGPVSCLDVSRSAQAYADNTDLSGSMGRALNVRRAFCSCELSDLSGAQGSHAAIIQRNSIVNLRGSDLSGWANSALTITGGGNLVNITGANTGSGPGSPNPNDTAIRHFNALTGNGIVMDDAGPDFSDWGSFTPVLAGSSVEGEHSYTAQRGFWSKDGQTINILIEVHLSEFDTDASGDLLLRGLTGVPLPNNNLIVSGSVGRFTGLSEIPSSAVQITPLLGTNGDVLILYARYSGSETAFPVNLCTDSTRVAINFTYHRTGGTF